MKKCSVCGYENEDSCLFCVNCGAKLEKKKSKLTEPPVEKPPVFDDDEIFEEPIRRKVNIPWKKAVIVLVVIAMVIGAVTFFLSNRELSLEQFYLRESVFLVDGEALETQIIAVVTPNNRTSKVRLIAHCIETGEEVILTDDGTGADTLANDGVFYGMVTVYTNATGIHRYELRSEPENLIKTYAQAIYRIYDPVEYQTELGRIDYLKTELDKIADQFHYDESKSAEDNVNNYRAVATQIIDYLQYQLNSGLIDNYEWHAPFFSIYFPLGGYIYEFGNFDDSILGTGIEGMVLNNADTGENGNVTKEELSMLLMLPFAKEGLDPSGYQRTTDRLVNAGLGYTKVEKADREVTIRLSKTLRDYRVIAINTHGGCDNTSGPFYYIGTVDSKIPEEDYVNRRLLKSSRGRVVVTPAFFEYYYNDGELNDCLIYLGTCNCFDNSRLADLLIRKGANAVLIYSGLTDIAYDNKMFESLMENMIKADKKDVTVTVKKALDAAKKETKDAEPGKYKDFWDAVISDNKSELKLYQSSEMSDFRLNKEEKEIRGKIAGSVTKNDAEKTVIEGARIHITGKKGYSATVETKSNGRYSKKLPAGEYEVTIMATGYETITQKVTVEGNQKVSCDAQLGFDPAISEFLNGFVSYTLDIDTIFYANYDKTPYAIEALKDLYARMHEQEPRVYKHEKIYDLNNESEYHLSVADHKAAVENPYVADWLDYSSRYDLNDVQAVLDKLYGKDSFSAQRFFGEECFITSDGYLLLPGYGTDSFSYGACGYQIRDVNVYDGILLVKVSYIIVSPAFVQDESGYGSPLMGTYSVMDGLGFNILEEGNNDALKTLDDYHDFAINFKTELYDVWTADMALWYGDDGLHIY